MPPERRKDYVDLSEIKVHLATVIERLDNVISHFERHQADDVKVADRVTEIEKREAYLNGKIFIISGICGAAILMLSKIKLW